MDRQNLSCFRQILQSVWAAFAQKKLPEYYTIPAIAIIFVHIIFIKINNMKKIVLLVLISFSCISLGFGQGFSFDELAKLRTFTYPKFESYVHDKGYELDHLEYSSNCTVFRNGSNVISYCKTYDDGFSYHNHVSIKFETSDPDQYEKVKKDVAASMDYVKTKMRRYTHEHYLEHIYVNDVMSVHMYDISYRNDEKAYYEIEIFSIYSGY